HVAAQAAEVVGDAGRLTQVVTNLLTNAINYNRPGGEVFVAVTAVEGEAVVTVADTGCGIPEEDRDHVFERFYRADRARARGLGGTGLGLAICKSIVDAHGGAITYTSEAGRGTTFMVRLPLGAAAPAGPGRRRAGCSFLLPPTLIREGGQRAMSRLFLRASPALAALTLSAVAFVLADDKKDAARKDDKRPPAPDTEKDYVIQS